ncbi:hypothetical protein CCMA1212_007274 [Trichoderma ghanense]|uniref:Amidase domain-containing protein n=1 Tax=Trichoderma ghanense TaxID=65468 RepID=A0ABY2GXC5_9HYPO
MNYGGLFDSRLSTEIIPAIESLRPVPLRRSRLLHNSVAYLASLNDQAKPSIALNEAWKCRGPAEAARARELRRKEVFADVDLLFSPLQPMGDGQQEPRCWLGDVHPTCCPWRSRHQRAADGGVHAQNRLRLGHGSLESKQGPRHQRLSRPAAGTRGRRHPLLMFLLGFALCFAPCRIVLLASLTL